MVKKVKITQKLRLSFSGVSAWTSCHRYWYLTYIENLQLKGSKSLALQVGDITHQLLHKYYMDKLTVKDFEDLKGFVEKNAQGENPEGMSLDVALEAGNLVAGYIRKYSDDPIKVISSELQLSVDRVEPITKFKYEIYGIVDAVCRTTDNRLWRFEHKTAAKVDNAYLRGLRGGLQGGIYHFLLNNVLPEPVQGTLYNMLVKTKIPDYYRMPVLMQKKIADRALMTFDGVCREIQAGDYYPDAGSCYAYNRECDFLTLCNNDTEETRQAFYTQRTDRKLSPKGLTKK